MVVCQVIVVYIGVPDGEANMFRVNDQPYYEEAET